MTEIASPAETPGGPPLPDRPAPRRAFWTRSRALAVGALVLAAAAVVFVVTRSSSLSYRLDFTNAGQLVTGDLVRIGGTPAGTVTAIKLTGNAQAQVNISLDSSFGPLHRGTTAAIRSPGLASVASRYIDINPGSELNTPLATDAVIGTGKTEGIVDIDQVFDALNARTRKGLQRLINGFGQWYDGKSKQANLTAQYFPPALQAYTKLFSQIDSSTASLNAFVAETGKALGAIDAQAPELTDLISKGRVTATALASDNRSLSAGLKQLPAALRNGSATFAKLRTQVLPSLTRLVNATRPVTGPLRRFLPQLDPVLKEAVPTFTLLKEMFDQPGAHNDLYDALVQLPQLAKEIKGDFPRAITTLNKSTPIFKFARPYIPDLVAWVDNWEGIFAPYDYNGHYARSVPVFDGFSFSDNSSGGELTQIAPDQRGLESTVTHGNTERCPGAAADGASEWSDSGAHCSPSEQVGN